MNRAIHTPHSSNYRLCTVRVKAVGQKLCMQRISSCMPRDGGNGSFSDESLTMLTRLWMTTAMSLLNIMSFFHLIDDFAYRNLIQYCSAVDGISEQVNPFKRQSSVCMCVCGGGGGGAVGVRACVLARVCVCKLRKLLDYLFFNFCIFSDCSMSFKIYKMRYYCDVVNVQPHFNFSDEIIILNLES